MRHPELNRGLALLTSAKVRLDAVLSTADNETRAELTPASAELGDAIEQFEAHIRRIHREGDTRLSMLHQRGLA